MFQKAEKRKVKLKLALMGPSGSGKTMSALRLAKGLGGKTAVIDSENGSASLYSDRFDFDVCELRPPFTTAKYIEAIGFAVNNGYKNVIVDSITPAWSGEGGILERKEQRDRRGGNSYANWAEFTKEHNAFMSQILQAPVNLIVTMRSKQAHEIVEQNGKKKVQKMGLKAEQRDGVEYEFTCVFDIAINHEAEATKDRTSLFDGRLFKITEETANELKQWLGTGKDVCPYLLKQIEDKLNGAPESAVERVGSFLDKDNNDKNEMLLRKVLGSLDSEIQKAINEGNQAQQ
jgi:GTPase SAR1 family protein